MFQLRPAILGGAPLLLALLPPVIAGARVAGGVPGTAEAHSGQLLVQIHRARARVVHAGSTDDTGGDYSSSGWSALPADSKLGQVVNRTAAGGPSGDASSWTSTAAPSKGWVSRGYITIKSLLQPSTPGADTLHACSSRSLITLSALVALFSEFSFAAVGFGPAVMYEIFWQAFHVIGVTSGRLEEAVWNSIMMSSAVAVVQTWWLRKHFDARAVLLMTAPLVVGLPLGTSFLELYGSTTWIKKILGMFFLVLVMIQEIRPTGRRQCITDFERGPVAWTVFAAFVGGFSRGLFGVSAPVSVLLLFFSLDRDLWRLINAIYRMAILTVQAPILAVHMEPQPGCGLMYASLLLGGLVGMVLGNTAAPHVSTTDLRRWLSLFLLSAGLLMLSDGFQRLEIAATAVSFALLLGMLFSAFYLRKAPPSAAHCQGSGDGMPIAHDPDLGAKSR